MMNKEKNEELIDEIEGIYKCKNCKKEHKKIEHEVAVNEIGYFVCSCGGIIIKNLEKYMEVRKKIDKEIAEQR